MILTNSFYYLTLAFIKVYKYVEMLIIKRCVDKFERVIKRVYERGGITIDGDNPWDIQVHDNKQFFSRVSNNASLGLGETYVEGIWDSQNVVELSRRIMRHDCYKYYLNPWNRFLNYLELYFFNLQTESRAWEVGQKHYDQGNELFESFLDPTMSYSCGYWRTATNLHEAQIDKMDLIAKKLLLKPGMKILDIGCGWGGLCKYLVEKYQVEAVGCTISKEGAKYAKEICSRLSVDIRLIDYREFLQSDEKFDRIISVGMLEHVGHNNYSTFFQVAHHCLVDEGLFLLHTIGVNHYDVPLSEPWFNRYIFPNGILPYYQHMTKHTERLFIIEDWHNFGFDYSKTLLAWHNNFLTNWPKIESKFGDKFFRLWTYYLQFSAGCFQSRKFQLWQLVLSKNGIEGQYYAAR